MSNTTNNGSGATLIGAGTTLKGDIKSNNDLRIDGTVIGNINSNAKIIVGTSGVVEGDIMLQLRGDSTVTGNIYAGKLQIEPTATFNGQCHMGANVVEISKNEQQAQAIAK